MPLWRQPCRLHSFVSQATGLPLQFIRHSCFVISAVAILMLIAQMCSTALAQAQSPNMIGRWNVEINFADGNKRSLRFDAQEAGKGTLLVVDPRLKVWGPGKPSEARWTREDQNSVTFTGPVEFMLGNVGRDASANESAVFVIAAANQRRRASYIAITYLELNLIPLWCNCDGQLTT